MSDIMKWTLVCYEEVEEPVAPYVSVHIVGIVVNERGERAIARVNPRGRIHIGMAGGLMRNERKGHNIFLPE